MPKFSKVLLFILVTVILILPLILYFFLKPKVSVRSDGVTIALNQVSFYIPSSNPSKIYKFDPKPQELVRIIEENINGYPGTFGIFIKNLSTGQEVSLNEEESFPSASLYKLFVMYTLYQKGVKGEEDNIKAMITVSSNESSLYLVDKYTSWAEMTEIMQGLGLKNTTLNQNPIITTPKDVAKLLELISLGKAVNLEASIAMLELMASQEINDRIPFSLPAKTLVAHKTGELEDVRHDAGVIITPENNFILVLMSKGSPDPESVKPVMSKISKEVYDFFIKQWANPPEIL